MYINQLVKSFITKIRYRGILRYYAKKNKDIFLKNLPKLKSEPLNILFLGSDYQQDFSGMAQALSAFGNVTYFTRRDGSYGLEPSPNINSLSVFHENTRQLTELVASMERSGFPPDLIIGQMWGNTFDVSLMSLFREKYNTVSISIGMDDRHTFWGGGGDKWKGSSGVCNYVDIALTSSPESVSWYEKEGCRAFFFPEASDPNIFYPMLNLPKLYDVSFVGARYGIREKVIRALRDEGVSVSAFGSKWEGGKLSTEKVPMLFAQSKIILGVGTIGHCTDLYALKLRDFDAPMSGSFYLTSNNQDLVNLYDVGHEIETYNDIAECVQKVRYYLEHDEERELIASRGYKRAIKDHTWHKRFNELFDMLRSS